MYSIEKSVLVSRRLIHPLELLIIRIINNNGAT